MSGFGSRRNRNPLPSQRAAPLVPALTVYRAGEVPGGGPLMLDETKFSRLIESRLRKNFPLGIKIEDLKSSLRGTEQRRVGQTQNDPKESTERLLSSIEYLVLERHSALTNGSQSLSVDAIDGYLGDKISSLGIGALRVLNFASQQNVSDIVFLDHSARPVRYLAFFLANELGIAGPKLHSLKVSLNHSQQERQLQQMHAEKLKDAFVLDNPNGRILIVDETMVSGDSVKHGIGLMSAAFPSATVFGCGVYERLPGWYLQGRSVMLDDKRSVETKIGLLVSNKSNDSSELTSLFARPFPTGRDRRLANGNDEVGSVLTGMNTADRQFLWELRALAHDMAACITISQNVSTSAQKPTDIGIGF